MAALLFPNSLILESRFGTSKTGNPYCVLQFLDQKSLRVYDLMQFGDSASVAAGLAKGSVTTLGFDIEPGREGGVRLVLTSVGDSDIDF